MTLRLFVKPPSPNNTKVLAALGLMGIDHELVPVHPEDPGALEELIATTGQPLTPAIDHDGVKLFDSLAILRYLDANFDGPRLYDADRQAIKAIEGWERYHTFGLGPWVGRAFGLCFSGREDAEEAAAINAGIHEATAELEAALAEGDWLVGDRPTAADLCVGSLSAIACYDEEQAGWNRVWGFMHGHFQLGEERARTRAHAQRVLGLLPGPSVM